MKLLIMLKVNWMMRKLKFPARKQLKNAIKNPGEIC